MNGMNVILFSFFLSLTICFFRSLNEIFVCYFFNSGRGRIFFPWHFSLGAGAVHAAAGAESRWVNITGIAANQLSMNMNEDV